MKQTALLLICMAFLMYGHAQTSDPVSRVRIHLPPDGLNRLKTNGLEFDHGDYDSKNRTFINEFRQSEVEKIRRMGYQVDVLVKDVMAYTDSLNRVEDPYKYDHLPIPLTRERAALRLNFATNGNYEAFIPTPSTFTFGSMGGFYNLTELIAQIDNMVATYPNLVQKDTIGNTFQGRPMIVVKISDNVLSDESEPEVLYTGMHHPREGMSMMNLIFYMRFLLENYATNASIKNLVDSRELFFIPVVNVDGFNYNTTATNWNAGRRMRRKTMTETTTSSINPDGSGGDGVDMNRNYPTYWGASFRTGSSSSALGSSDAFSGPSANSEIETQNMMNFVNGRNFRIAFNYHCHSNLWIRPQGPDSVTFPGLNLPASAINTYNSISAIFTKYNCYEYGTPDQVLYEVNGYSDDWFFSGPGHAPIYAFSPEIGSSATDGFWAPQSRIIPLSKELIFANIQAAYTAGGHAELQDTSDIAINNTTGSLGFTVTRRGLVDAPVTVTLIPLNNIDSVGSPVTFNSIAAVGTSVSGSIHYRLSGSLAPGNTIRYVWQLSVDGMIVRDTITKFFQPTTVFFDNMNDGASFASRWVNSGTGSAWGYDSDEGVAGSGALTESVNSAYAAGADHSIRLANTLDLTNATQARLSFLMRYTSENCMDRLQLEVSTTGVSGTYTPIVGDNSIRESRGNLGGVPAYTGSTDSWVREIVDLAPYIGSSNIALRFRFRSDASNGPAYSTNGFQIDNLRVIKSSAIVLPQRFEDIWLTRQQDMIVLRWKAVVDASFVSYTIQRSANGVEFTEIATLADAASESFTDRQPMPGKNYYRIQLKSRDGSVRYSRVVVAVFEKSFNLEVYPNPVKDRLIISLFSAVEKAVIIEVISNDGRPVYRQSVQLQSGDNRMSVAAEQWASQLYMVRVKDVNGNTITTNRIVKIGK